MSRSGVQDILPLSPLQEGLLFLSVFDESAPDAYAVQQSFSLEGELDAVALRAAAESLLTRHSNLRVAFRHHGVKQPVQIVPKAVTVSWTDVDLSGLSGQNQAAEIERVMADDRAKRFDLARPPLIRFMLIRLAADRYWFVLTNHHILLDGWSKPLLVRELFQLYLQRGDTRGLPDVRPFRDYLAWLAGRDRGEARQAWSDHLAGLADPTLVAVGRTGAVSIGVERVEHELDEVATGALTRKARELGLTLNTIVQGAWAIALARLVGRDDVVFGVTVSGRPPELPGIETMVGLFINTVPMRVGLRPAESLTELLARLQDEQSRMSAHQHLGLGEIQQLAGHGELFDTSMVFENYPVDVAGPPPNGADHGLRIVGRRNADGTHYPLTLVAVARRNVHLRLDIRPSAVDPAIAKTVLRRFLAVLQEFTENPRRSVRHLELLAPDETAAIIEASTGAPGRRPATLPSLFDECVRRVPDGVAVVAGGKSLTYAELDGQARRLASRLVECGVGPEVRVGLLADRSVELVVATLGVAMAGGAYVPLHPNDPVERMRLIVEETGALLLLTDVANGEKAACVGAPILGLEYQSSSDEQPRIVTESTVRPDNLAYVMYTSGSSGRPKGVAVTHRDVAALARDRCWDPEVQRRVLLHAPHAFDAATYEFWVPILSGGTLVVAPPGELSVRELSELITGSGVTALWLTAGLFGLVADEAPESFLGVHEVWTGGDVVATDAISKVRSACPSTTVVDGYGPTETTTFALRYALPPTEPVPAVMPIGRPLDGMRTLVLDTSLRLVDPGFVGELYVAGDGVARGYLGRPDRTAERFVADPFGAPGERMYRTGDLVRRDGDGTLAYVGRSDRQVKLRGFRVELGEVEAAVAAEPGVSRVTVLAREDRQGDRRLVAYVVGDPDVTVGLGARLAARLPGYLVPAAFVALETFPLTRNGKLDVSALPAPSEIARPAGRAPRDPREEILCVLFAAVLGLPAVDIDDDFFACGGHSLLATRLVSRIRSALGVEISIRQLFETPTVASLGPALDIERSDRKPLVAMTPRPERVPASYAQRRLLFLDQIDNGAAAYTIPLAVRLTGLLDIDALRCALGDVAERHESLRTVFVVEGDQSHQVVLSNAASRPRLEVTAIASDAVDREVADVARHRFDLSAEPPMRAHLFTLGPDEQVLLVLVHHIAGDGWSVPILARDLGAAYQARLEGEAPIWDPLPVQYADYALWQRALLGTEDDPSSTVARQLTYWREQLAALPTELQLPADRVRPAVATHRGGVVRFEIEPSLHRKIIAYSAECNASPFMVMQALVAALLSQLGAGDDIPLGTPIAGRTDEALDDLVGFFVNTLVLRTDCSSAPSLRELVARVRATDLAAYDNQDVPFERLVELLNPERSLARHPLFQVMLTFNNTADLGRKSGFVLRGLRAHAVNAESRSAKFDLMFAFSDRQEDGGLGAGLEYSSDLFDEDTARSLVQRLLRLAERALAEPDRPLGELDILSVEEQELLAVTWQGPVHQHSMSTLPELFDTQVVVCPDTVAVVDGSVSLTYAELARRSRRLARTLIGHGIGPESLVAVALPRSAMLVTALVAILEAGAAYVPLDPEYPAARIELMLAETKPSIVLTSAELAERIPLRDVTWMDVCDLGSHPTDPDGDSEEVTGPVSDAERTAILRPSHPAYVIYTSGSTGRPKGITMTASAVHNLLTWHAEAVPAVPGSLVAQFTAVSFDVSVQEILSSVLFGKTLVSCPEDVRRDPPAFVSWLADTGVTELYSPTVVIEALARAAEAADTALPALTTVAQAGEALTVSPLLRRWIAAVPDRRLHNHYGPAETHVVTATALVADVDSWSAVPSIGQPVCHSSIHVLDGRLRRVPPGVTGELYVAGAGLARGYLNQPARTGERFVADPFGLPGTRMYRTGDLARWNRTGELDFLGRADDQVKVRGFRIELGEVESVLSQHPDVASVRVVVDAGSRLIAYVVPTGEAPDPSTLRKHVGQSLPEHMVPAAYVSLNELPLNSNGKLDRRALPAPDRELTTARRGPRDPREAVVARLFGEVLGLAAIGIDEDFFELGGHSFLAAALIGRIRVELGVHLPVRRIFEARTVEMLAASFEDNSTIGDAHGVLLPLRAAGTATPIFCVHPGAGYGWCYARLLAHLDTDVPLYGLQARGLDGRARPAGSIEEMAADYAAQIRTVQPSGPYRLLGWSFGGNVAHSLAGHLIEAGQEVELLAILDAYPSEIDLRTAELDERELIERNFRHFGFAFDPAELDGDETALLSRFRDHLLAEGVSIGHLEAGEMAAVRDTYVNNVRIMRRHVPRRVDTTMLFFQASRTEPESASGLDPRDWTPHVEAMEVHRIDAAHGALMTDETAVAQVACLLTNHLQSS